MHRIARFHSSCSGYPAEYESSVEGMPNVLQPVQKTVGSFLQQPLENGESVVCARMLTFKDARTSLWISFTVLNSSW